MNHFADKVVVITGAASGFGCLLAEHLAQAQARLVLADIAEGQLQQVAENLKARHHAQVLTRVCDVSQEAQVEALMAAAVAQFGALDIGVNNAGISAQMKPLIETSEDELDRNFAVNAKGVFFGMKYQIRQMLQQSGGIVLNVASLAGLGGAPKLAAYSAAKHAVVGLTKTAALEYGSKNIRCNAICPYYSQTPMIANSPIEQRQEVYAGASPMKRLGQAEEIVQAMLMMIDPANSYLNGQAIAVDGGVTAF